MKNLKFILVLFATALISTAFMQDFHASTTKVEYENNSLKLTAKFFTADLETAVGASVSNKASFDSKAKSYTNSNLVVKVNGSPVALTYVGSQTNDKSTRLYLKADNVNNINEIEIRNSMLINSFSDQQNLVTFDVNGVRKSFTAKKGGDTGKVTF
ncbi:DUF6702 family protein [Moheibacter lacus]|uniref:M penetrans family 1 protein n=1 Tax=Moheibacter lacus TaxID=2745851 RepID=A0A838ZNB2_9FLAO|nr:DUF6702 family protein [Moheibacter lacus]MBA5629410.1 M penetrans family 1 protein [Moheibacter lacus]